MTGQDRRAADQPNVPAADRPTDLEQTVDELEERVLGHRVEQVRSEDDDENAPAFEQDLEHEPPGSGPTAEPS